MFGKKLVFWLVSLLAITSWTVDSPLSSCEDRPDLTLDVELAQCEVDSFVYRVVVNNFSDMPVSENCLYLSRYLNALHPAWHADSFEICFPTLIDEFTDTVYLKVVRRLGTHVWSINDVGTVASEETAAVTNVFECQYDNNADTVTHGEFLPCRGNVEIDIGASCEVNINIDTVLQFYNCPEVYDINLWVPSDSSHTLLENTVISEPGVYFATATDSLTTNTCWTRLTVTESLPQLNLGSDFTLCDGEFAIIQTPDIFESYTWSTMDTTNEIFVSEPGLYSLQAMDSCGRVYTDFVNVTVGAIADDILLDEVLSICFGESINLQSNFGLENVSWSVDGNPTCAGCDSFTAAPTEDVTITIEGTSNNCFLSDEVNIEVIAAESSSTTLFLCEGDSVFLAGNWIFAETMQSENFLSQAGCDSIHSTIVEMVPLPNGLSFEYNCETGGYEVSLSQTEDWNTMWSNGNSSSSTFFEPDMNGGSVVLSHPEACTLELYFDLPSGSDWNTADLPQDTTVLSNTWLNYDLSDLQPSTEVSWSASDLGFSCVGCYSQNLQITQEQTIIIELIDSLGCPFEHTFTIRIQEEEEEEPMFDIPNIFSPNGDGINENWAFTLPGTATVEVLIYDRWGNLVAHLRDTADISWDGTFHDKPVEQGVYAYLILYNDLQSTARKIAGDVTVVR